MKRVAFTFFAVLFMSTALAQVPQLLNYQGVARDSAGNPIPNQNIGLQIAILQGSINGAEVYKEVHDTTTNSLGLFTLQIGNGIPVNGLFEGIDWGSGSHFLQIGLDESGGNNYQLVGASELVSVPYALFAENGSKWNDSEFNEDGLQYGEPVVVGEDVNAASPLLVNNARPTIDIATNTALVKYQRIYQGSKVSYLVYGYPDTDLVLPHLRKSVMLYATDDADDLVLCATQPQGKIRFFTQAWTSPNSERMRISENGNIGIGTTDPNSKLQVTGGDVYIENINSGVIMKSPNGQCWRMTVSNVGEPVYTSIVCPQ